MTTNGYWEVVDEIKQDMKWPHKINVVCSGEGAHKTISLVQMWVDKLASHYTRVVIADVVSRNTQNIAKRDIDDRYRQLGEGQNAHEAFFCGKCNEWRKFKPGELDMLFDETAWENKGRLDISYAADLAPFARIASETRKPRQPEKGDWRNDPSVRPPKAATKEIWRTHAEYLGLNVNGLGRMQIVHTVNHYYPVLPSEPRRIVW